MKSIVIDIDGVLADFAGAYEKLFGEKPQGAEFALDQSQWDRINEDERFWLDMRPLEGARALAERSPLASEYYILTSRSSDTKDDTLEWLAANGIRVREGNIIFTTSPGKLRPLARLAPAIFIDDSIINVGVTRKLEGVDAYLLITPQNREAAKHFAKLQTVASVDEFLRKADKE